MKIVNLIQGSAEWHQFRAEHFTASDASAMLGTSPYKTRDQLLHEKATGAAEEVSPEKQRLFDKGHAAEAVARMIIEEDMGEDIFPVTGTADQWPVIAASLDGITFDYGMVFEHKLYSKKLIAYIEEHNDLPDTHWPQVEQQLYVSGASSCKFVVSDGTVENWFQFDYVRQPGRIDQVLAGWKQFEADLANYTAPEAKPEPVAEQVTDLPSVVMQASGSVSVQDNFATFEQSLTVFLENHLIRKPETDNDFATLDLQIKAMKKAEDMLKLAGDSVLAQVEAVDLAMKKKDSLQELVRQNRLMAEKLVKSRKEEIKMAAIREGQSALSDHVDGLVKAISEEAGFGISMPKSHGNFTEAVKNKRTMDSLRSAANDELARAKIESNQLAELIRANLREWKKLGADEYCSLFPDISNLVVQPAESFGAVVKQRIDAHEAEQKAREEAAYAAAAAIPDPIARSGHLAQAAAPEDVAKLNHGAANAIKQPRTLGEALSHFGMQKNLSDNDTQELLDIVAHYTNLNAKAA